MQEQVGLAFCIMQHYLIHYVKTNLRLSVTVSHWTCSSCCTRHIV